MPIRWSMGASSAMGQTFILEKDGELYESRVSWFRELKGRDPRWVRRLCPGRHHDAAGRLISGMTSGAVLDAMRRMLWRESNSRLDKLTPGVQCAHCHQGIDAHLAAMLAGNHGPRRRQDLHKLIGLSAEQAVKFLRPMPPHLGGNRCAGKPEHLPTFASSRIASRAANAMTLTTRASVVWRATTRTTTSVHRPVNFDPKCLACHGGTRVPRENRHAKPGAKVCPVAKDNCVSCHMPKLDLPGAHLQVHRSSHPDREAQ